MKDSLLLLPPLMVVVSLAACEVPARDPAPDSAEGVREVQNTAADMSRAPSLALEETLRIGVIDGPRHLQFARIADVNEGSDRTIYVLDGGSYSVGVFDRAGSHLRTFGRRGQGPGEFQRPLEVAVTGDTVIVVDDRRPHLFSTRGEVLATSWDPFSAGRLPRLTPTPSAWLFARLEPFDPPDSGRGPYRPTTTVRSLAAATGVINDPIATLPGVETYLLGPERYHVSPFMAPSPGLAIAMNGTIFLTAGDDYRIDVRSADGRLIHRIVAEVARVPVTRAQYDGEVAAQLEQYKGAPADGEAGILSRILREDYPALPHATARPVVGRMLAAPNGRLLVERLDLDPSPFDWTPPPPPDRDYSVWDVFDDRGRIAGRVTFPHTARITPRRLTDSALLATVRDSLDVQYVVRYRLEPERRP